MTKPQQQFRGELIKMPFAGRASLAQAMMLPLITDNDFEVFSQLDSSTKPVYLSIAEHFQLLSELVAIMQQQQPETNILVRVSMPGGMRLPANLLADNVLLMEQVQQEEQLICQQLTPVSYTHLTLPTKA